MNRDILSSFLKAGKQVLGGMIGQVKVDSGPSRSVMYTSDEVSILVHITGQLQGVVTYGMSEEAAMRIASAMMGLDEPRFNTMVASAVSELGNIISGHALAELSSLGYNCELSPPRFSRGTGIVKLPTAAVTIPYHTDYGQLDVRVALTDSKR